MVRKSSPRKISKKVSKKASRKVSKKVSRKVSKKVSRKVSKKVSRKASKKVSRKVSRKASKKVSRKASKKVSRKVSKKKSVKFNYKKKFTKKKLFGKSIYIIDNKERIKQKEWDEMPDNIVLIPIYRENAFQYLEKVVNDISKKIAKKSSDEISKIMTGFSDYTDFIEDCLYHREVKSNLVGSKLNKEFTSCFIWHLTNYLFQETLYQEYWSDIIITKARVKNALLKTRIDKILE